MPAEPERPGALVVSLDLERDPEQGATTEVITRILELFEEREIHATWALSFAREREHDPVLASIAARPHQEIALLSRGDVGLASAVANAERCGVELRSLAFADNRVDRELLLRLAGHGFIAYRGPRPGWAHKPSRSGLLGKLREGLRLADNFSLAVPDAALALPRTTKLPVELPVSRLVRPFDPQLRKLDPLRVHRLQSEMTTAAEHGQLHHLWLRPESFAAHPYENMVFLDNLLRNAKALEGRVGLRSLTMAELASAAGSTSPPPSGPS